MSIKLNDKLGGIIGGKTAAVLQRAFGLSTVQELLFHFPRRYLMRGELTPINELPEGEVVTIVAEVRQLRLRPMMAKRGSILEIIISDGNGLLTLTFFNQNWRQESIKVGDRGVFSGKISSYRGQKQLSHPDYELFEAEELNQDSAQKWAEQPVPIYPATAQLPSWKIAKAIDLLLSSLEPFPEIFTVEQIEQHGFLSLNEAFRLIHQPLKKSEWESAVKTIKYFEAFLLQSSLLVRKKRFQEKAAIPRGTEELKILSSFDKKLPFQLSEEQSLVGAEIQQDLAKSKPMMRLLQGEVGSGKTIVALRAMLTVAQSGGQSVLLAPTEVLAAQHFRSVLDSLGSLAKELKPVLLTGQLSTAERKNALLQIVSCGAKIIVGTHAVLSEQLQFFDLALVVVDEQHRFGVEQRASLVEREPTPHQLVMTATPIPRTVALTVFGDLEISTITRVPEGRAGISSHLVPLGQKPGWESRVWERMAEELAKGRQVYVVCPAIEEKTVASASEEPELTATLQKTGTVEKTTNLDKTANVEKSARVEKTGTLEAVTEEAGLFELELEDSSENSAPKMKTVETVYQQLRQNPLFANYQIERLHGRLSSAEKDRVMNSFNSGASQILVATTVIEVGVNVPNASMIVVLSADRFGIAQLHQLRGRVGRGSHPGLALFVTEAWDNSPALERLEAVAATTDGFELAKLDLELRREGNVLGSSQSGGRSSLKLLRVVQDSEIILQTRELAEQQFASTVTPNLESGITFWLEQLYSETESNFLAKS